MKNINGGCLCGQIRYEVSDDFKYSGFCHCSDCRRFSGSACSAMAGIPAGDFRLTSPADTLKHYAKSENTVLAFCGACGSSLYAAKPLKGMIHLRLGTLDTAPTLHPQFHSYVGSKAAWDTIADALPQYEAGRS